MKVPGLPSARTLRVRLTVLLSAAVMLATAAVGLATNLAIHSFLISRLDEQLTLAGSRFAISLEHDDRDADNAGTTAVGQPIGTLGARVVNGTVTAIGVVSDTQPPLAISAADRAEIATLTTGSADRTIEFAGLGTYRLQVADGRDGDVLVTGLPQQPVDDTMDVLLLTELIVFVAVGLVVGAVGGFAVRRSLRPLERVAATALRVSELPLASGEVSLDDRVPGGDERTEVGQVALAVNHMLTQIETALTERHNSENRLRRFIADASHELRTPLAVVRSHAELITLESAEFPASVRDSLRSIESGTRRMSRLVDDMLLLARLDSGVPLENTEVDLTRLALDSVSDARIAAPEHRWSLDLPEEPVLVRGDEQRLHQVIVNLLANARLHTPVGSLVVVKVSADVLARLEVVDNGPGIAADLLPHVTERFVRGAGRRARSAGSSGLGLAIVDGIVAAHGGTVTISSRPGQTRVLIELALV